MNLESHNIACKGKCDGSKNLENATSTFDVHGIISSRAASGAAMSGNCAEGSETRSMSASNNSTHEYPATGISVEDIVQPAKRLADSTDKEPWLVITQSVFARYNCPRNNRGVLDELPGRFSKLTGLEKFGELLEVPQSHDLHSEAGNGKRDGLKSVMDWMISSEAPCGAAMSGRQGERSTIRSMSANNNSTHERRTAEAADDMTSSRTERPSGWIKSQSTKNARRATFDSCQLARKLEVCYLLGESVSPQEGSMEFDEQYRESVEARVIENITEDSNGCWVWGASCDDGGIPQVGGAFNGKQWGRKVHRLTWEWTHGPIPKGGRLIRVEGCKSDRCVFPDHFYLGTTKDQTRAAFSAQPRPTRETDRARFMDSIRKTERGCWVWKDSVAGNYGAFWLDGSQITAHRASIILFTTPEPTLSFEDVVQHKCPDGDDTLCVNPEHLEIGTHQGNMIDRYAKSRARTLSAASDVSGEIMQKIIDEHQREIGRIARKFFVTVEVVETLVGIRDGEVSDSAFPEIEPSHTVRGKTYMSPSLIATVKNEFTGERGDVARLAKKYGIKYGTLHATLVGRTNKHIPPKEKV